MRGGHNLIPLIDRIQYDEATGCWNWKGATAGAGYGVVHWKGEQVYAHRFSAMLWLRFDLKSPLQVLHRCDNPACFNPKHLFIGTQKDNIDDAKAKGRVPHLFVKQEFCKNGHSLTPENRKGTQCRLCSNAWARRASRKYPRVCVICSSPFVGCVPEAETCSHRCRAVLRWKKRKDI